MNKLIVAISTFIVMTVVFAGNAFADTFCPAGGAGNGNCGPLPGQGGGGCSVIASNPGTLAALMVTVGLVALVVSRKRK